MTTYTVWAKSKSEAVDKARALAEAKGIKVVTVKAEKFPAGEMYHVNWVVRVFGNEDPR